MERRPGYILRFAPAYEPPPGRTTLHADGVEVRCFACLFAERVTADLGTIEEKRGVVASRVLFARGYVFLRGEGGWLCPAGHEVVTPKARNRKD